MWWSETIAKNVTTKMGKTMDYYYKTSAHENHEFYGQNILILSINKLK